MSAALFHLPDFLRESLREDLMGRVGNVREPDFLIGGAASPYLRRWFVMPRGDGPSCYLHHFLRSDDDRALHDHPWPSISVILEGSYLEHVQGAEEPLLREPGDVTIRGPEEAHRVELLPDGAGGEQPVWTLFLVGPRVREWGFLCPQGWRHWKDFCGVTEDGRNDGTVGRGCE